MSGHSIFHPKSRPSHDLGDVPDRPVPDRPVPDRPVPADTGEEARSNRAALEALERTLLALEPFTREARVPASVMINPLLDVWDAAHQIGPDVTLPVEALLTLAVHRSMLLAEEIDAGAKATRQRAVETSLLAKLSL